MIPSTEAQPEFLYRTFQLDVGLCHLRKFRDSSRREQTEMILRARECLRVLRCVPVRV